MGNEEALARLAARQHGLFVRAQANQAGYSNSTIDSRVRQGRWVRVDTGVFRVAGAPFTWRTRLLACCLAGRGVASHRSAAVLHGLDDFRSGPPELVIPRGRQFRREGVRSHEIRDFDLLDECQIDGIPTTGIEVTLFHLGAVLGRRLQGFAIDDAVRQKLVTWEGLYRVLTLHARRGRKGTCNHRSLLDERWGTAIPASKWSRLVESLLIDAGVPQPVLEHEVFAPDGTRVGSLDLAWPVVHFGIELQSMAHHLGRRGFETDPRKRNAMQAVGWDVFDYTWRFYVDHPARLCREVEDHLHLLGYPGGTNRRP